MTKRSFSCMLSCFFMIMVVVGCSDKNAIDIASFAQQNTEPDLDTMTISKQNKDYPGGIMPDYSVYISAIEEIYSRIEETPYSVGYSVGNLKDITGDGLDELLLYYHDKFYLDNQFRFSYTYSPSLDDLAPEYIDNNYFGHNGELLSANEFKAVRQELVSSMKNIVETPYYAAPGEDPPNGLGIDDLIALIQTK